MKNSNIALTLLFVVGLILLLFSEGAWAAKPNASIRVRVHQGYSHIQYSLKEKSNHFILELNSSQFGNRKVKISKKAGRKIAAELNRTPQVEAKPFMTCGGYRIEAKTNSKKGKKASWTACTGAESETRDHLAKVVELLSEHI